MSGGMYLNRSQIALVANAVESRSVSPSTYFRVLSCTAPFYAAFDSLPGEVLMSVGQAMQFAPGTTFKEVKLRDPSGATNTIIFVATTGQFIDDGLTDVDVTNDSLTVSGGDTIETPAKVSVANVATLISAASTTRNFITVQNHSTTQDLWLGDANIHVANKRGIKVLPGSDYTISTGAAIYGIVAAGTNDVSFLLGKN